MPETPSRSNGPTLRAEVDDKLLTRVAAEPATANTKEIYKALAQVARDRLARRWVETQSADRRNKSRRVYYMSMEFLVGRALSNGMRSSSQPLRIRSRCSGRRNTAAPSAVA